MSKVDGPAAKARAQLRRLPESVSRRTKTARLYGEALEQESCRVPRAVAGCTGTWRRYLVAVAGDAADAVERGKANGVSLSQPVSGRRWAASGSFPVSDRLHRTLVSVPIHASLTDSEVDRVRRTIRELAGIK